MKKKEQSGTEPLPLGPAIARFALALEDGGYPKSTPDQYLAICRKFDGYLARRGIASAELRDDHVDAFLVEETAGRKLREGRRLKRQFWRRPIALPVEQLRGEGSVPPALAPAEVLGPGLAEHLAFPREHRGMSERTVERQRLQVSRLLTHLGVRTEDELARISIEQIDRYLVHVSRGLARQSMGAVCSSIRGLLGHLGIRGVLRSDLRAQVSTPKIDTPEDMPRARPRSILPSTHSSSTTDL